MEEWFPILRLSTHSSPHDSVSSRPIHHRLFLTAIIIRDAHFTNSALTSSQQVSQSTLPSWLVSLSFTPHTSREEASWILCLSFWEEFPGICYFSAAASRVNNLSLSLKGAGSTEKHQQQHPPYY
mmetsp:Transcript_2509/g.9463  ORF Transcript_2509/g.9463 Transcript_2509/m.9463 type:complete len:125 (-) Transcript_2509:4889-5263(-)